MLNVGNNKMLLVTVRDMSIWAELERQKNLSSMKTIAFAQAAHEFRNPLNGIISSLDLLTSEVEESNNYFKIAKSCSNTLLYLVNDILDYSQIEAKKIVLNIEACNTI